MVCVERGEGGPFYSPNRSVPALNKYGNIVHRLRVDKNELPAKTEADWHRNGAGQPCDSAGPWVAPLTPPLLLDIAKWAPNLCMSVPGLCSSVFSIKWAHFEGETRDVIFCVFFSAFTCVFIIFHQWVPADHNSPKLVEFVSNNSYHYCRCSFFMSLCRS